MPSAPEPSESPQPTSFETALTDLAELVSRLESGSLGLTESIAAYERGVGLLLRLHEELSVAEEKVRTLVRVDDEGRPILAASDPPKGADAGKTPRTAGRKPRSRSLPGMDDAEAAG